MKRSTVMAVTLVLFGGFGTLGRSIERTFYGTCPECGERIAQSLDQPQPSVCRRCVTAS